MRDGKCQLCREMLTGGNEWFCDDCSPGQSDKVMSRKSNKPEQYQIGIDTFARMEANSTKDEILAFCRGNIDKYNWRKKGQDLEDLKKIIDYANFAIKQIEND